MNDPFPPGAGPAAGAEPDVCGQCARELRVRVRLLARLVVGERRRRGTVSRRLLLHGSLEPPVGFDATACGERVLPVRVGGALPHERETQDIELDERVCTERRRVPLEIHDVRPERRLQPPRRAEEDGALQRVRPVVVVGPEPKCRAQVEADAPVAAGEAARRQAERQVDVRPFVEPAHAAKDAAEHPRVRRVGADAHGRREGRVPVRRVRPGRVVDGKAGAEGEPRRDVRSRGASPEADGDGEREGDEAAHAKLGTTTVAPGAMGFPPRARRGSREAHRASAGTRRACR